MFGGFPFGGMGGFGPPGGEESGDSDNDGGKVDNEKYYKILGVEKNASQKEIVKAYRKKAMSLHPDRHPNEREKYQELFKELGTAYEVLKDPDQRKLYDRYGEAGLRGAGSQGSMSDIFDMFFSGGGRGGGRRQQRQRKAPPIRIPLDVTLEDLYIGASKQLKYKRFTLCRKCNGKGGSRIIECAECNGQGVQVVVQRMGFMTLQQQRKCPVCDGEGTTIRESDKCRDCSGKGMKEEHKSIDVHLPMGSRNAEQVVMRGFGHEVPNAANGDLVCIIRREKHDRFQRIGADLAMEHELSLKEALCGYDLRIPHLSGHILRVKSKPGETVQHNEYKVVYSWGMPQKGAHNVKGHLYIKFSVKLPDASTLSDNCLKQLAELLPDDKKDSDGDSIIEEKEQPKRKSQKEKPRAGEEGGEDEESEDDEPMEYHEKAVTVEGEPSVTPASAKSAYHEDDENEGVRCRTM